MNLSKFYPRNPLFTPQNGVEWSTELTPYQVVFLRPQMTQKHQKIKMDRPVTRIYTGICTILYNSCFNFKDKAISQFRLTLEKTLTLGFRLDVIFHLIRLGIFYMDHDLIERNIEKAQR